MKRISPYISAAILGAFGLLTLFLSTSIFLDLFGIREKEGNYVLFVVIANFISSILYIIAAYGFIKQKKWTSILLGIATILLLGTFVKLNIYVNAGGIHEDKTVIAMIFRTVVTFIFTVISYFTINKAKIENKIN